MIKGINWWFFGKNVTWKTKRLKIQDSNGNELCLMRFYFENWKEDFKDRRHRGDSSNSFVERDSATWGSMANKREGSENF